MALKERLELIAVVNEAPVALQSRDLSEAAAECSSLTAPALAHNRFPCYYLKKNDELLEASQMKQIFESENISFVRVTESLVKDYLTMVNDIDHVARFIGRRLEPISEEKEIKWVREKQAEQAVLFSMLEKKTGAFIGNIELMDVANGAGELGIAITAAMQDKGYGTEAIPAMVRYGMDTLGLRRIFLKVYPDNARAIRVYEKCGFREYDQTADDVFMEIVK